MSSPNSPVEEGTFASDTPVSRFSLIFTGFKVTEWKTASTLFSDNPLVHLNEETDDSGYKAPVPDNSFPQSFPNLDGSNNPFGDANTWESPENAFGSDNKRRKRRNSGNPWDDFDDRFGNLPTKLPEIPKIQPGGETFDSEDDTSMDGQRQAIYPGEISLKT